MSHIIIGDDNISRCQWCAATTEYIHYHDTEWGFPVGDDFQLFEKICLESFQSGLSWRTILAKRENFRQAFHLFNFERIAAFTEYDVTRLLQDAGIVRHRGKIEATINNAKCAQDMIQKYGSLSAYFWGYEPAPDERVPSQTVSISKESIALSKDLKKRGWKFVGPTTIYAFMQAMGIVNDHAADCETWSRVEDARKIFERPILPNIDYLLDDSAPTNTHVS